MAGSAINPYDGDRHSLSDPRSDDHSWNERETMEHHDPTWVFSVVALPPPPCSISPFCTEAPFHLGPCNTDALELVELDGLEGRIKGE